MTTPILPSSFPCEPIGGSTYTLNTTGLPGEVYHNVPGLVAKSFLETGVSVRSAIRVYTAFGEAVTFRLMIDDEFSGGSLPFTTIGGSWSPPEILLYGGASLWKDIYWQIKWTIAAVPAFITVQGLATSSA